MRSGNTRYSTDPVDVDVQSDRSAFIRLEPLRSRIEAAARRPAQDSGQVVKRRGVHASAPVFAGTRIRVSTVQDYLRHGFAAEAILEAFPDLRPADVDEARRLLAAAG